MSEQMLLKLNNGIEMPMAGIGTFLLSPDEAEASVISALKMVIVSLIRRMLMLMKKL